MGQASNAAGRPPRSRGLILGVVLGAAIAGAVVGFLWNLDSARQKETIRALNAQISEKDGTIATLYAQIQEQGPERGSAPSTEQSSPGRP